MSDTTLITAKDVAEMMSIHVKTFYAFLKKPEGADFPKPISLGKRTNRWKRGEVEMWIKCFGGK
jgi:predicted DNA-binding transcriptional regulator AlpA